jgi:hypothetical protein
MALTCNSYNHITTLDFLQQTKSICSAVIPQLGNLFPELESATFYLHDIKHLKQRAANYARSYYDFVAPLPRLRKFKVAIPDDVASLQPASQDEIQYTRAASLTFMSIIHQAPNLQTFSYMRYDLGIGPSLVYAPVKLFSAIKDWKDWVGISNKSLKSLYLNKWALEWDLLNHQGFKFQVPNIKKVVMEECTDIKLGDRVQLMKNEGSDPSSLLRSQQEDASPENLASSA